ncbi:hypothetical protein [uncultured Bacteroides sp.]|uniref:hypothetical protein n=1 Tax=uncultured Bacteroides sp. TaxID=162156 RepID=UPI0025F2245E|nr:hypothetical protein [uncultured Bacteroides sp.]
MKRILLILCAAVGLLTGCSSNDGEPAPTQESKVTLFDKLLKLFRRGTSNKQEGLNSITDNPYKVVFGFELEPSKMNRFKEEVLKLPFRYLNMEAKLEYITFPDDDEEEDKASFDIAFPDYVMDKYCYFYPKSDFKYYMPEGSDYGIELEIDEKKEVDLKKLLNLTTIIENDIKKQLNPNKFRYWVADRREEIFENKEWSTGCPFCTEDHKWVGWVHTFCGNATFTGHEDYDKADYARITLYNSPNDEVYFIDLKSLENNTLVSSKGGQFFFRKEPVDYIRLEFCELLRFMCHFAEAENEKLLVELW